MAKIKFRRDTAATWTEANPVLAQGEPGFEHNTGRLKIGDGVTAWNSLAYSGGGSGGGDLTTIIVPEQGTAYKGLQVSYGVIHSNNENNNELNVNKIVIHKPAITTTEIDPTSENDYFRVAGLSNSNVLAMFVIYGDVNGAKPLSDLKAFAEAAIDNVILNNAIEENYNTVGQMKAAFYDNYPTLASAAGGLDQDFVFFQTYTNAATGITTVREGSGAIFTFEEAAGSYSFLSIANGGSNYLPGHKLVVLGSALGGTDGINDALFTVNTVDAGAITSVNLGGTSFATAPVGGWTLPASNYQVGSGFVVAGVGKNQDTTLYTNTNSQGSGYVVNDVLTLLGSDLQGGLSPDNDITITITGVDGSGIIQTWTVTGTFPNVWPDNNIGDGGNDQYDTGNYINSSFTTQIAYNAGNTVSDGTTAFGAGSSYSFVYNTGIFGLFVSGNSSTYIETSGNSGGDGVSTTEAGNIYGPNEPAKTFDNAISYINIISNPYAGPAVNFTRPDNSNETIDILIADSGVDALETIYLEQEQQWIDVRDQDAADIAPATRAWADMPSYQAYDIMVATFPVEPAPPGNILPVANNAKNAYLAWQEALGLVRGVAIARDSNNQGIFNPYRESGWDQNVSPAGTLWNTAGWNDLSDVETRTYDNLYAAFGSGGLGNKIVGAECVMYLPDNGKYYTVKFSQWTQNANGGGFAYTRRELNLSNGIGFADGTRLTSAEGVGRVKLTSPGDRRIEEAYGYKEVSVTEVITTNLTATASRAAINQNEIWFDTTNTDIDNVLDNPQNFGNAYKFEFSLDNANWYTWDGGSSSDGNERGYNIFPQAVTYNQGDTVYFRYSTGGTPVVWWNKNELPGGGSNFRGAVIDYHAWTGSGTWIGTIHIVDDDSEENITHTEVSSGSTDTENDDLWLVQNEGTISYRRTDGDAKTAKIQWTAKVFYGSELYD